MLLRLVAVAAPVGATTPFAHLVEDYRASSHYDSAHAFQKPQHPSQWTWPQDRHRGGPA